MKSQGFIRWSTIAAAFLSHAAILFAQGTAFTYQGRLHDGGTPATGSYDFQFTVHSAASGNVPVSATLATNAVPVSNGLFTVTLDFGAGVFTGGARWLNIEVKTNAAPGVFASLTPRTEIASAPYAVFAGSAAAAGSVAVDGVSTASLQNNAVTSEKIADGTIASNDLSGTLLSNTFWRLSGNANTTPGTHFLGTTDNQPLDLRVNNLRAFRVQPQTLGTPAIVGGLSSTVAVDAAASTIAGGYSNTVASSAFESTIGGGAFNTVQASANQATIAGGAFNQVNSSASYGTVSGGRRNIVGSSARYSTIAGGSNNTVNASFSAIAGGAQNFISGPTSIISGGFQNSISREGGTIGGGVLNSLDETNGTIGGGIFNSIGAGRGASTIAGGFNNHITGSQGGVIAGGVQSHITGNSASATVGGGYQNFIEDGFASVIAGGFFNLITGTQYGSIGGGYYNTNSGSYATVPGGTENLADGNYSLAAGRRAKAAHNGSFVWADSTDADFTSTANNQFNVRASGGVRFVTSGAGMSVDGPFSGNGTGMSNVNASSLGGIAASGFWQLGGNNVSSGQFLGSTNNQPLELRVNNFRAMYLVRDGTGNGAHVFGGSRSNGVRGLLASSLFGMTVGGGGSDTSPNLVSEDFATIGGGIGNIAGNTNDSFDLRAPTVGGGERNRATESHATVGGGIDNVASGWASVIAGGTDNRASGTFSTIAGGTNNTAAGVDSMVGGGSNNDATGDWNAIGGGAGNTTSASHSTVAGGWVNTASNHKAAVGGGSFNVASGFHSTVPGGSFNEAQGDYSLAAGRSATAAHDGSFVWADDLGTGFSSTTNRQFAVRANNGVMIQSTNTALDLRGGGALRVAGAGIGTGTPVFTHRTAAGNVSGHITTIDHPHANNEPNAILLVTHNWQRDTAADRYETHPIGVYYASGQWRIFHEDLAAMPEGRAFNVIVFKP